MAPEHTTAVSPARPARPARRLGGSRRAVPALVVALATAAALSSCGTGHAVGQGRRSPTVAAGSRPSPRAGTSREGPARTRSSRRQGGPAATATPGLPAPGPLSPFSLPAPAGSGAWAAAGRPVDGTPVVYETTLVPTGGTQPAGIAWMDTRLLSARLYSGSLSPGGGPYPYTAPVEPAQAASLVAIFNGGFQMKTAEGGYYTTGQLVDPLVPGSASLVIYRDGSVNVGAWGSDVTMTPDVVGVRQNLVPLVAGGRPTAQAESPDWQAWGNTCGATSCSPTVPGVDHQWRSGVGVTADGALVYATGPTLDPLQLAQLLVRAGAVRGMQLDINPDWTVFVTYDPATAGGLATPSNGSKLLPGTVQGPATFFDPSWARDFITMSAAPSGVPAAGTR